MKSPFDQNTEQEPSSQQSYERNLSRDYAPSERAKVRALDQRAAFNEATLKQRAEVAGEKAEIARSQLELAKQHMGLADIQSQISKERSELANNDAKAKAMRELTVTREANGFLRDAIYMDPTKPEFDEQYRKMLAGYQNAPESKAVQEWITAHVPIAKLRREREDLLAKEERARNKETEERTRISEAATKAGAIPITFTSGGITMQTPAKADAAEAKAEMVFLEKERKLSVDQFAKARNARTRAGAMLESAQKAKNQYLINAANDLIKAADSDINEWKTKRDEAESALKARLPKEMPAAKEQPKAAVGNPNGMPTPAAPAAAPAAPAAPAAAVEPVEPAASAKPNLDAGAKWSAEDSATITRNAQQEAMRRYPALGIKDSAENTDYLMTYWNMKQSKKTEFFDNPEWPIVLAEELAKRNGWKRSDKPTVETDSITPEEYNAPRPVVAEPKQYASEADARKNGAKAGEIIILINPKTGKPGRARLN